MRNNEYFMNKATRVVEDVQVDENMAPSFYQDHIAVNQPDFGVK